MTLLRDLVFYGGAAVAIISAAVTLPLAGAQAEKVSAVEPEPMVQTLSAQQLRDRLALGNVRLIDVRTAEEVAEGMIPGAEHIPLDDFDPAKLDPSDSREIIIYCRSGRRSQIAAERLAAHSGEPVLHLAGGINAWIAADGSLEHDVGK